MIPQKLVKEGKKVVKMGEYEVELAPAWLIKKIAEENRIEVPPPPADLDIEPTEVDPGGKVNVKGHFPAPSEEGKYMIELRIYKDDKLVAQYPFKNLLTVRKTFLSPETIKNVYTNAFEEILQGDKTFQFADSSYLPANIPQIKAILDKTKIELLQYGEPPFRDCDDFANALFGILHADPYKPCWQPTVDQAIFITWVIFEHEGKTYGHALLSATDGEMVIMIEPQTDEMFKVPKGWKLWLLMG